MFLEVGEEAAKVDEAVEGFILSFGLASKKRSRVKEFQRISPSTTILKNSMNSSVGRVLAIKATK